MKKILRDANIELMKQFINKAIKVDEEISDQMICKDYISIGKSKLYNSEYCMDMDYNVMKKIKVRAEKEYEKYEFDIFEYKTVFNFYLNKKGYDKVYRIVTPYIEDGIIKLAMYIDFSRQMNDE